MERSRIVFSGSGGQGVITAAIILAKAAAIFEGKNAIQSQSYGAAARGGATRTDIVIADEASNPETSINVCLGFLLIKATIVWKHISKISYFISTDILHLEGL